MQFKDHFSGHAASYAEARPSYPATLFEFIASQCRQHKLAWDCATGNGQAALALTAHFGRIVATDASQAQLQEAPPHPNIDYRCMPAEQAPEINGEFNVVTVAQALHWFDIDAFFHAVDSVLGSGGILAIWSYGLTRIDPAVDPVIVRLYEEILGVYWPAERALVEQSYASIEFPYKLLETPAFEMQLEWSLPQLLAYLNSWSATQRYLKSEGSNPLHIIEEALAQAWGSLETRTIRWPLTLKMSRK